jgi:hypothetical protein
MLYACTGRTVQRNRSLQIIAGNLNTTLVPVDGSSFRLYRYEFKATSPLTTLVLCALGVEAFGPMIDHVAVATVAMKQREVQVQNP